ALMATDNDKAGEFVLGLWLIYLLYRVVVLPVRWLRRKGRQKREEEVSRPIEAMKKAWQYSRGTIINPLRLKELVLAAEHQGAVFPPVLHTLIDRAIQRDPTALLTRRQSAPRDQFSSRSPVTPVGLSPTARMSAW